MTFGSVDRRSIQLSYGRSDGEGSGRLVLVAMRGGKCVERWSTADMLGLLIQIGAVPPPGA